MLYRTCKCVSHKNAALGRPKISPPLLEGFVVVWFVDDSYAGSTSYTDTYERCDVRHVTFCETFCSIERVDPYLHFILVEFIRELVVIKVSFRSSHTVHLF